MIVRWAPGARDDRAAIWEYVAADDPRAAARLDEEFSRAAAALADFPTMGRSGLIAGTRELFPVPRYRLVYEAVDEEIRILALVHTSRRWPGR
ncbi:MULTISPECIES: type II toxin-antitoxin system RelE/ParE family toxin [unclassified Microbacterium]|uniref:type II toxin-antitoxin system RelE/ParE family toxin n=1 Tax=unclassified Microbacterium TaxID=2609290 RepID=UPI00097E8167|nr:type II toxin-antitoxin system RelE/ParE family toxin [Microbacterium sp. JB110]RCS60322.1 type II toxin-antitoxin system RelE/ParE family toxin [Microbacterium sp. JB110]SJM48609.1 Death on curing protein, Doc toxin [Frigoribacterium sp. JB110]